MKRTLSLIIALTMVLSTLSVIFPACAANASLIDEVEAKYFDVKPFMDGYISEAEWGAPTVLAEQDQAATAESEGPVPNRFFYTNYYGDFDPEIHKLGYLLWLRWDEDCFYIGAKVYDPDGHALYNVKGDTWNGDALRVKIDPEGANAFCYGEEFYPEDSVDHKPWGSAGVCDLIFGYCLNAGGYKEIWDATKGVDKTLASNSPITQHKGVVEAVIARAGSNYSSDTQNGITTYEIAIPWAYIDVYQPLPHRYYKWGLMVKKDGDGNIIQGPDGAIGYEYGMSAAVYNASAISYPEYFNSFLTWGSGVTGIQETDTLYHTCAGSNAVILSGDRVSEDAAYDKNFDTYTYGGPVPPLAPQRYDDFIDMGNYVELTYDDESDMDVFGTLSGGCRVEDEDRNMVVQWDKNDTDPPTLNTYISLSTRGTEYDGADDRWISEGPSFTAEFDIKVTGLEVFQEMWYPGWGDDREPRPMGTFLVNEFGGVGSSDYYCGYYFEDKAFKIVSADDPTEVVASVPFEFTLDEWHHWVFQYDNDTCRLRFYFDPKMTADGIVSPLATPVFDLYYRYFDYGYWADTDIFKFRRMNAQIMLDNVKFYNFVDFTGYVDVDISNYTYEFAYGSIENIVITGYTGEKTRLTVPSVIDGYKVIAIADGAFEGLYNIERVTLPSSVTRIGKGAFNGCISLEKIIYEGSDLECDVDPLAEENPIKLTEECFLVFDMIIETDRTEVIVFEPEKQGRYVLSASEMANCFVWIYDSEGNLLEDGFRTYYPLLCHQSPSNVPFVYYKWYDAKPGDKYYIVIRSIEPNINVDTTEFEFSYMYKGDALEDGEINTKDVLMLRQVLAGIADEINIDPYSADADNDGEITTKDVLMIRKYLAGLITEFP